MFLAVSRNIDLERVLLLRGLWRQLLLLTVRLHKRGDKGFCDLTLSPAFDIEITDDTEHHRADEVDKKVSHGIVQADIKVTVET